MATTEIDHDLDIPARHTCVGMHRSAENNRFCATAWRLQIDAANTTMTKDTGRQLFVTAQQKYRNKVFLLSVLLPRTGGTMNLLTTSSKQLP